MSQAKSSRRVVLANRPQAGPIQDDTFKVQSDTLMPLSDGEVLVRVEYVSVVSCRAFMQNTLTARTPLCVAGLTMFEVCALRVKSDN